MVNAFVVIGLFPFTRLVHIFTVPLSSLWRPYQVNIWKNDHAKGKDEMKIETKGGNREVG
jgi:nitrate reductase gamma subunit